MFLLFGTRAMASVVFVVVFTCGHCGAQADQRIVRRMQRLTLFFVPLFSIGTSWWIECTHCGIDTPLSSAQAAHAVSWASSHGHAMA